MFCSSIIATIGRPSLQRTIQSVLDQEQPIGGCEIIVVNDSGKPLPNETWQNSKYVRVISTNDREKSIARNTGAAIAWGEYLHFLDDDDFLLPGALVMLHELSKSSQAILYYGGSTLTDRNGKILINLQPDLLGNCFVQMIAGEWIPLGSYIVNTESFFELGGFNPLMTMGEDSDLCRRLALIGDFLGTSKLVLQAEVGDVGSTADYRLLPVQSRAARELILDNPLTYYRMLSSATNSYWYGRIVRVYLSSFVWNLKHKKLFVAASRLLSSLRGGINAGKHVFNSGFLKAILRPHRSSFFRTAELF
jgi:glycosyltransferase involved in cell wall biosynthesis